MTGGKTERQNKADGGRLRITCAQLKLESFSHYSTLSAWPNPPCSPNSPLGKLRPSKETETEADSIQTQSCYTGADGFEGVVGAV